MSIKCQTVETHKLIETDKMTIQYSKNQETTFENYKIKKKRIFEKNQALESQD